MSGIPTSDNVDDHSNSGNDSSVVTSAKGTFRPTSLETLIGSVTQDYLSLIADDHSITMSEIRDELLRRINAGSTRWLYMEPQKKHRPGSRLLTPEPLIEEFDLRDWMNKSYTGHDMDKRCFPFPLRANYLGVRRIANSQTPTSTTSPISTASSETVVSE